MGTLKKIGMVLGLLLSTQVRAGFEIDTAVQGFLAAQMRGEYRSAVNFLSYDKDTTASELSKRRAQLARRLRGIHQRLGGIRETSPYTMPIRQTLAYEIGVLLESQLSNFFISMSYFVRYDKAGDGVITFIIGKQKTGIGIERVQFWCFSCVKESLY